MKCYIGTYEFLHGEEKISTCRSKFQSGVVPFNRRDLADFLSSCEK